MNYSFAGAGTIPGGEYEAVSVSGSAKLAGDVRCTSFKSSGALGGTGSIDCSGVVRCSGSAHVSGEVRAKELRASGAFKCGWLGGGELRAAGAISVGGDIEADSLSLSGSVSCPGLVNADSIEMHLDGRSRVGSIGGSRIDIRPGASSGNSLRRLFGKAAKQCSIEVAEGIEGDDIYLEWVSSPRVVGRSVVIGPGCSIGCVQYSESVDISPDAVVDCVEQI